ncbi:hypothetical protein GDO78_014061 [Eleutherodactylus coqui]|uniref:C2H2-type domain-containing protein n=2 Tax=Eleutherodactylus coqui TaxID=57060 RepID=A0A8J6BH35_ELECQ|nr:hypothetical protein GDO78_014061 [Eleutherodactylus coqui]
MGGEVESGEDGVLAGDQIYPPPCLKSTNLRGHPPEWVTNLNYVDYPITPRHINAPYTPSCIIEVATVCEEGDFTSPDIYTPTAHKTTLHASDKAEETPMSWGKDVIYTKFYTPEELTQADLTSIKKELVSWEDGGMELQNVYVRPKRREDKAASARGDAAPWSRGQAHRDSYLSLENAALHIKTEYDQGDFGDHSGTSGQLQPLHAGNLEDCRGAMIKKANATKTMSIISYSTDDENDSGRAAYAVSQLYGCADCKKCFTNDTNLAKHRLLCRGRKPHVCSACGKCFASASYLVIHERIHTGEKPYSCSHCGKSFTRKPDLIRHERIHTGEKPFSCPECGKCFTSVSNIFMHRRIHTGEKPFPCAECGKRFIKKSDLVRHEKIHLPQKPLPCSHCGHFFSSKTMLSKHMALHAAAEPGAAHGGS